MHHVTAPVLDNKQCLLLEAVSGWTVSSYNRKDIVDLSPATLQYKKYKTSILQKYKTQKYKKCKMMQKCIKHKKYKNKNSPAPAISKKKAK